MKNSVWIVIIVVIAFFGFFLGYSIPSFQQAGSFVSDERKSEPAVKMDKDAQEYYKNLLKDEN